MRVLITGIRGFVGHHLTRHLLTSLPDMEIHGTMLEAPEEMGETSVIYHMLDLRDFTAVLDVIAHVKPVHIYHLAAQAFVPRSFEDPWETLENNIRGQLNVIQACLALQMSPRILVISSGEIYGAVAEDELPIHENTPLRPSSPYSVSKVAQDMLGLQYFISHGLPIMRVRPFNHLGPGQNERFVAPAFAMQIARIEAGQQEPDIYVGDLTAKRDFTDVRDIVQAYRLVMESGAPGEVYNVASGKAYSVQALLDTLLSLARVPIQVQVDPERLRPTYIPILWGDTTRLRQATGWQPEIPFEQTLQDVLADCRQRVQVAGAMG